jgi:hypothetical protein
LPEDIKVGDFNGDGFPDLVAVGQDGSSQVYLLLGNGDGTFRPARAINVGKKVAASLAVGDVN